jgi:hypothetical protein
MGDTPRVVRTRLTAIRLDEFLKTRVVEIAVHGLDMARARGREPWVTVGGCADTREVLVGLLGFEPPASLNRDDITFIETGTGRRPLTGDEGDVQGPAGGRLPLLA